jgi:hypothetical protein
MPGVMVNTYNPSYAEESVDRLQFKANMEKLLSKPYFK